MSKNTPKKAPRIKEQYKDNAIEVNKNAEAKDHLRQQIAQYKIAEIQEKEDCSR